MTNIKLGFDPQQFISGLVARGLVSFETPAPKSGRHSAVPGVCAGLSEREYQKLYKRQWREKRRAQGLSV